MGYKSAISLGLLEIFCGGLLLSFDAAYAHSTAPVCSRRLVELMEAHKDQQPETIVLKVQDTEDKILVFNSKLKPLVKEGMNASTVQAAQDYFEQSGSSDIKVEENGAVVAAQIEADRGGYGVAVWIRDEARVFEGKLARNRLNEARSIALGILAAMSTSEQLDRLYANIRDPGLHFKDDGIHKSQMNVLHIRMSSKDFSEVKRLNDKGNLQVEEWNHKQNDAIALSYLVAMRAFELGLITEEDLSPQAKIYLAALPAYLDRIQAHLRMWEGGAWEEGNGLRTSSVILVVKLFEILQKKFELDQPYNLNRSRLQKLFDFLDRELADASSSKLPEDVLGFARTTLEEKHLAEILDKGYQLIFAQLPKGEVPTSYAWNEAQRYEDVALSHAFWYPPDRFKKEHFDTILKLLKRLERESGILRYTFTSETQYHYTDLYMYPGYYLKDDEFLAPELTQRLSPVSRDDLHRVFDTRRTFAAYEIFGRGMEAQWFQDSILAYANLFMFERFGGEEYLRAAEHHTLRAWGQTTPEEGGLAADARMVKGGRAPEAVIPQPIYKDGKLVRIHWLFSPNSPLNWATAERDIMMTRLRAHYGLVPTQEADLTRPFQF